MEFLNIGGASADTGQNLWTAAGDGDLATVQQIIGLGRQGVNAQDENGYACLHAAASYGHVELARWLLDHGADSNIADHEGDTPLHFCESPEVAQLLISNGALARAENGEGATPQDSALQEGRQSMVAFWLSLACISQEEVDEWDRLHGEDNDDVGQGGEGYRRERRNRNRAADGMASGDANGAESMN